MQETGEKRFEPTQARLERAKREGNVATSKELGAVAAFGAALAASAAVAGPLGVASREALLDAAAGRSERSGLAMACALMLVPVLCAALGGAAVSLLQSGGLRLIAIGARFERLSPAEGLKRMFSREAVVAAVRALLAFACAAGALWPVALRMYGAAVRGGGVAGIAAVAWSGALRSAAIACAIGAAFALADYGMQLANWRKKLRMSFDELRREQREHDGDPAARGRRKSFHRQLSVGSLARLHDAAFVITNPTHIAIALEYRPPEIAVPRVLVRAADEIAALVRERARALRIPLLENVPLARALYASARPGDAIPAETYVAVAEIVAALVRSGAIA
ncbi:MAG TPA: EscU/YscU/HrcU family type III secretion system export apparatus switch protein [Candidatus Baltobacteraceae bacterium]|jgi:flagellar biosynthesis protein FlhB